MGLFHSISSGSDRIHSVGNAARRSPGTIASHSAVRGCALAAAIAIAMGGCCQNACHLQGDKATDDNLATQCRKYRPPDPSTRPAGLSNKAQDIERSFGIGE
jgi:hypothetical protein